MRTINLNEEPFFIDAQKKKFLLLGNKSVEQEPVFSNLVLPKIKKETGDKVPGLWGTLGLMNDNPISWGGALKFSEYGNDSSSGVTLDEIELIYAANPQLDNATLKVTERFISFEDVQFDFPGVFSESDVPRFRLTLMLDNDEGALVYFQYSAVETGDEKNDPIAYIRPQSTDDENSVNMRDRLTYFFEAIPSRKIIENEGDPDKPFRLSQAKSPVKFLIKILTYKRGGYNQSADVIKNQLSAINGLKELVEKNPKLLIFDTDHFRNCDPIEDVDVTKKTLLLIHGTFSTTAQSFHALIESGWLKNIIDQGVFEQIIAFDHPTVFEDAVTNINTLVNYFNGEKFSQPIDVIASSQGGLLAQQLANLPDNAKPFVIRKVVLVASANGVKYVNTAMGLDKILSVLKVICKGSQPALAFICALAQHSIEFFIKQPGIDLMKPDSERLNAILNNKPANRSTLYLPIIDDFTKELVADDPFFKRMAELGLDLVIRAIMGKYNDWVVQSKNQFRVPAGYCAIQPYNPDDFQPYLYPAIHGKCLDRKDVCDEAWDFLNK
jgi:hypothetical protein